MNGQLGLDASIAVVSPLSVFQGETGQIVMLGEELEIARLISTVSELKCEMEQEQR
jgi:hypothetical protein